MKTCHDTASVYNVDYVCSILALVALVSTPSDPLATESKTSCREIERNDEL